MNQRGHRGWIAACSAACILSLGVLAVDRFLRREADAKSAPVPTATSPILVTQAAKVLDSLPKAELANPIVLSIDPGLTTSVDTYPELDDAHVLRSQPTAREVQASQMIRRPPEPVAGVTLLKPFADGDLVALEEFR